jgi:caffeoyl-CoA O-methyltransferase
MKMKSAKIFSFIIISLLLLTYVFSSSARAQKLQENPSLDEKVKRFLDSHSGKWHDMNVPASDGKLLYDIIIRNNYTSALEIGTSTGHSAIWIAWALSKTGGKLITIEIDKDRHKQALVNFKEAGLDAYIDAHLADAHKLVYELKGPFDFVFSDADKWWYKDYFMAVDPKITKGGCYTAHNVRKYHRLQGNGMGGGISEFINYVDSLPGYETTIDESGAGVSISYKKSD